MAKHSATMSTMNFKLQATVLHLGSTPSYSAAGRNTLFTVIVKAIVVKAAVPVGSDCMRFTRRCIISNPKPGCFDTLTSLGTASSAGIPFLSRGRQDSRWCL